MRPAVLVCLGRTAAQALPGRDARMGELRGRLLDVPDLEMPVVVTVHPSAVSGRVRRGPSGAWSSHTISYSRGQPPGRRVEAARGG